MPRSMADNLEELYRFSQEGLKIFDRDALFFEQIEEHLNTNNEFLARIDETLTHMLDMMNNMGGGGGNLPAVNPSGGSGGGLPPATEALFGVVGSAGEALAVVGAFGIALYETIQGVREWSRSLMESNFRIGEFSGAMQAVAAQQEIRNIELSMARGDARAGSTAVLSDAVYQLDKTLMPLENQIANAKNELSAKFLDGLNTVLVPILQQISKLLEKMGYALEEHDLTDVVDYLKGYGADKIDWAAAYEKPQRFIDGGGGEF